MESRVGERLPARCTPPERAPRDLLFHFLFHRASPGTALNVHLMERGMENPGVGSRARVHAGERTNGISHIAIRRDKAYLREARRARTWRFANAHAKHACVLL